MIMQEVRIRKSHNCISYAADRLGVAFPYDSVKELIGSNDFDRFKYNQDELAVPSMGMLGFTRGVDFLGIYPYVRYSDINEYQPDMILRIRD